MKTISTCTYQYILDDVNAQLDGATESASTENVSTELQRWNMPVRKMQAQIGRDGKLRYRTKKRMNDLDAD